MKNEQQHSVFLVGIGGIGMSALARYYHTMGCKVAGYDKTSSAVTNVLVELGIQVVFTEDLQAVDGSFLEKENSTWVYTPAIPKENTWLVYFQEKGEVLKRSEALAKILEGKKCLAVAGTHGKTSTTAWLTHLLKASGIRVCAFIGGVTNNYNSNLVLDENPEYYIIEADEFDRSFHRLNPLGAIITTVDADHLDIYGTANEVEKAFADFVGRVNENGALVLETAVFESLKNHTVFPKNTVAYGLGLESDVNIQSIDFEEGMQVYASSYGEGLTNYPGDIHLLNALAAATLIDSLGIIPAKEVLQHTATFKGVKRRFDVHVNTPEKVYIDDYAHHPTELHALRQSVESMFPDKQKAVLFQPHLFSRTRDFMQGFAEALTSFDEVFLLDIYPARELPIEGISSAILLEKIRGKATLVSKEEAVEKLLNSECEVLITAGAGDIDRLVPSIISNLEKREVPNG